MGQELSGSPEDYEDVDWLYTTNVRGPKCKVKHLMKAPVRVEEVNKTSFHKKGILPTLFKKRTDK